MPPTATPPVKGGTSEALHPVDASFATGLVLAALAALRADAVELHAVAADDEAEEAPDPLLETLEFLAGELDDLPAALADDVVVMLRFLLGGLVAGLAVVEMALGSEPAVLAASLVKTFRSGLGRRSLGRLLEPLRVHALERRCRRLLDAAPPLRLPAEALHLGTTAAGLAVLLLFVV